MLRSLVLVMLLACAPAAIGAEEQSPPPSDGGTNQCEREKGEAQTS